MKTLGSLEVPYPALPRVLVHPRVLVRNSNAVHHMSSRVDIASTGDATMDQM